MRTKLFDNIINFGRSVGFNERHALDVNKIALTIFDQLQNVHRMGNTERLWLETAALLHDVGKPDNRGIHHKLARDVIADFSSLPFGKKERKIIGLIARYHRGGLPSREHKSFGNLDTESRHYIRKLASILRIADGLVSGKSKIKKLACDVGKREIIFHLKCRKNISLNKAVKKANLFVHIFGRSVIFDMKILPDYSKKSNTHIESSLIAG
ncbi:MAG: HD domain-containing protein [Sedimentisphaerales bacterium]|nr:HD domain-containing protein [Sedimentisphaerales bacterium]